MEKLSRIHLIEQESEKIGVVLSKEEVSQFEVYLQELTKWNEKTNLTGHKDEKSVISNLFIDSLAFLNVVKEKIRGSILDIGTGAGFPGLVIKIAEPSPSLTLVEPNLKKVSFLHHIIGTLGLKDVNVESKRIEGLAGARIYENAFDFIILKALRFDVCFPYVRPLLREDGKVVVSRSKAHTEAIKIPGFFVKEEIFYQLPFGFGERVLVVLSPANN